MNLPYIATILVLCLLLPLKGQSQTAKPSLRIQGEVERPLTLTVNDLARFKTTEVKAKTKDGKDHLFTGVDLVTLLDSAGVTLGSELRGNNLTKYVLIKAADGYQVVFSLAEVDPEFTNQVVLLAYLVDGKPLPKGEGPFRIVAPSDKKQARWTREIVSIKIVSAKEE